MKTRGIHHIVLIVSNVKRSKEFYEEICGMRIIIDNDDYFGATDGNFFLFAGLARSKQGNNFNKNNIGLDHWAFRVKSMKDLREIEKRLKNMKVKMEDGGITDDNFGGKAIFTSDPDGMKVEFHLS